MQEVGVVVDVAHASKATLKDIVAYCKKPVIGLAYKFVCYGNNCGRHETWEEMEWIASTDGVVLPLVPLAKLFAMG